MIFSRSDSTGPANRSTRTTGTPAEAAICSADSPARIRAWISFGVTVAAGAADSPGRGSSPRNAAVSLPSSLRRYSPAEAFLPVASSTDRPSSLSATTWSSRTMSPSCCLTACSPAVAGSLARTALQDKQTQQLRPAGPHVVAAERVLDLHVVARVRGADHPAAADVDADVVDG